MGQESQLAWVPTKCQFCQEGRQTMREKKTCRARKDLAVPDSVRSILLRLLRFRQRLCLANRRKKPQGLRLVEPFGCSCSLQVPKTCPPSSVEKSHPTKGFRPCVCSQ